MNKIVFSVLFLGLLSVQLILFSHNRDSVLITKVDSSNNRACQEAEETLADCLFNNPNPNLCNQLQRQCDISCNGNCIP